MDITTVSAPPPGTAAPGNLYIDSTSRQIWLGVDPAVDPAAALLVSDIVKFQTDITSTLTTAKAYTDTQITTRAPTVHTHVAAQITDFTGSVQTVVTAMPSVAWVRGMIMMWSGSLAEIGVGGLAGWALCDGANGTPNLRDRFVLGAGNKVPGSTNPSASLDTNDTGQHTHAIAGTVLTIAQMAQHAHGTITGYVSNDHTHNVQGSTGNESTLHTHAGAIDGRAFVTFAGGGGGQGSTGGGFSTNANTNWNDRNHTHAFNVNTGGISANHYHAIPYEGGNGAHTHVAAQDGVHHHNITSQNLRDATPYFALAFIMRL